MTRRDLALILAAMAALTAAVIFAVVITASSPPATSDEVTEVLDQVAQGQATADCRSQVNARFDAAFALVAMAELNDGQYPDDLPPGVRDLLLPVGQARTELALAAADKARLQDICPT